MRMYNNGAAGGSRPPTSQMPEMRYANSGSPRPPTGTARPYTAGAYQEPPQPPPQAAHTQRPPTQGSTIPPSSSHSHVQGYDLSDPGRRPSMPTPAYDRPSYSRGNSPGPYTPYNESQDDFHRQNYEAEETYPLTAYPQIPHPMSAGHPMTPGTPGYDEFEGDTGNSGYSLYPLFRLILVSTTTVIDLLTSKIPTSKTTHTVLTSIPYTMRDQMFDMANLLHANPDDSKLLNELICFRAISSLTVLFLRDS